jgi:hypothetical protein
VHPAASPQPSYAILQRLLSGFTDRGSRLGTQDLYHGLHPNDDSSIFVFIAVFAAAQLLLSQLPTMRHLRHLNLTAVVCTAAFVIIVSTECINNGGPRSFAATHRLRLLTGLHAAACVCHQHMWRTVLLTPVQCRRKQVQSQVAAGGRL